MMDEGRAVWGRAMRSKARISVCEGVSQVDSLGTVSYIHRDLYISGLHTDHGLCAQ